MSSVQLKILHTNDFHGTLNDERQAVLASLRAEADLYFDTGDCIKTGNLGIPLRPEAVWPRLAKLNCSASVPGNRESHVLRSALDAKLAGHMHPILCANLFDKEFKAILPPSLILDLKGVRVGIFGVMVPMVTEKMKSKAVSQMIWTQPIPAAIQEAEKLRSESDFVIALTHIGHRHDVILAESTDQIDLILGGHSHTVLSEPQLVNKTWICQGGSHGRFVGSYVWEVGRGLIEGSLIELPRS